jgi:aromatic ring-opening dioxygenase LigB subunit
MLEDWQAVYAHTKAKSEKAKEALNAVQQFMEDSNSFVVISSSGVSTIEPIEIEKKQK